MKRLPQISEAEFEVMKVVWKLAPINTNEITERLERSTSWSPKTIQTLIKRLVNKGALAYENKAVYLSIRLWWEKGNTLINRAPPFWTGFIMVT